MSRRLITGSAGWANWCRDTREIQSGFPRRSFWRELPTWPRRCMRCPEEALEAERTRTPTTRASWRRYSTSTRAAATPPRWTSTAEPRTRLRGRTATPQSHRSQPPATSLAWLASPSPAVLAYSTQLRQVSPVYRLNFSFNVAFCIFSFCLSMCTFKFSLFSFSF